MKIRGRKRKASIEKRQAIRKFADHNTCQCMYRDFYRNWLFRNTYDDTYERVPLQRGTFFLTATCDLVVPTAYVSKKSLEIFI